MSLPKTVDAQGRQNTPPKAQSSDAAATLNATETKNLKAPLTEVEQVSPAPAGTTLLWLLSIANLVGLVVVFVGGRSYFKTIEKRGAYDAAARKSSKYSNREIERLRADLDARIDREFRRIREDLKTWTSKVNELLKERLGSRPAADKDTDVSVEKQKEGSVGKSKNPAEHRSSPPHDRSHTNEREDVSIDEVRFETDIGTQAKDGGTTTAPAETTNPSSKSAPPSGNEMLLGQHRQSPSRDLGHDPTSPSRDRDLNHDTILACVQQNNDWASIQEIKQKIADLLHSSESDLIIKNLQPIERSETQFRTSNNMGKPGEGVIIHFIMGTKAYFLPTPALNDMAYLFEGWMPGDQPDKFVDRLPELEKKGDVYELVKRGVRQ